MSSVQIFQARYEARPMAHSWGTHPQQSIYPNTQTIGATTGQGQIVSRAFLSFPYLTDPTRTLEDLNQWDVSLELRRLCLQLSGFREAKADEEAKHFGVDGSDDDLSDLKRTYLCGLELYEG